MTTITARTVNELYRHHLLQLVLTFHGGMQAIGFNWGSFNYYSGKPRRSPDDVAIRSMAQRLSTYAAYHPLPSPPSPAPPSRLPPIAFSIVTTMTTTSTVRALHRRHDHHHRPRRAAGTRARATCRSTATTRSTR